MRQWFTEAEAQFESGQFQAALASYHRLLTHRLRATGPGLATATALDAVVIERLVDLAVLFGDMEPAFNLLEAGRKLYSRNGNFYSADFIAIKAASIFLAQGHIRHAQQTLATLEGAPPTMEEIDFTEPLERWEARHRWDGPKPDVFLIFSRLYLEMARILAALGQYFCSDVAARRGLHHMEASGLRIARQAEPALKLALATAKLQSGSLAAARNILDSIQQQHGQFLAVGYQTRCGELMGKLNLFAGKLGDAKQCFQEVVNQCRAHGFRAAENAASLNLAHVLILLNQTRAALSLAEAVLSRSTGSAQRLLRIRAQVLAAAADERAKSYADGPSLASSVYGLWSGDGPPEAETGARSVPAGWEDADEPADYLSWFEDQAFGFHWRLAYHGVHEASHHLDAIDARFQATDSPLIGTLRANLHGTLLYYQGRFESALSTFEQVLVSLRGMGAHGLTWQVLRFASWSQTRLGRVNAAARTRAEAENLLERLSGTLPWAEQAVFSLNKWTGEEEYLAGEFERLWAQQRQDSEGRFRRWLGQLVRAPRLLLLIGYLDRYRCEIAAREAGAQITTRPHLGSLLLWLFRHGWRTATIRFIVLPDRVIQICCHVTSIDFSIVPLSRILVRQHIADWHYAVVEARGNDASRAMHLVSEGLGLSALLRRLPKRIKRISFVPDDALHGLPFAALPFSGGYLVERFAITIGFRTQRHRHNPSNGRALVVSVTEGNIEYPPLPSVWLERARITETLTKKGLPVDAPLNPNADAVVQTLPGYRFMHIACHGIFRPDAPAESGFVLFRDSQPEVLSLRTLHRTNLRSLELAVLASCWAADNFVLPGRWIISLPETLQNSGVSSVLGCLWEVDDQLAPEFLDAFYGRLAETTRAEALRQTQLDCLRGRLVTFDVSDPIHWAGYQLYGAGGAVRFPITRRV